MPIGTNIVRCRTCLTEFACGDCIESECRGCQCRRLGHLRLDGWGICGRCGAKLPPRTTVVDVRRAAPGSFVYVGRRTAGSRPLTASPLGNPFNVSRFATDAIKRECLEKYRRWLMARPNLLALLPELRGKRLGCWCGSWDGVSEPKLLCHAALLAELADGPLGEVKK